MACTEMENTTRPEAAALAAVIIVDALRRPEKRLLLAILEDAITALFLSPDHPPSEVDAWISADDRTWPFSFVNVCEVLGLDCSALRAALWLGRSSAPS